jgi:hypothetical protein
MTRGTSSADYDKLLNYPKAVFLEDPAYINGTVEYRKECGLEPMKVNREADFTGLWKLNECETSPAQAGGAPVPYKLEITRRSNDFNIKTFTISEYSDDEVAEQTVTPDAKDKISTVYRNSPRVQNAAWSPQKDTLTINSKVSMTYNGKTNDMKSTEIWVLKKRGKKLSIAQTGNSYNGGKRSATLIYDKQ